MSACSRPWLYSLESSGAQGGDTWSARAHCGLALLCAARSAVAAADPSRRAPSTPDGRVPWPLLPRACGPRQPRAVAVPSWLAHCPLLGHCPLLAGTAHSWRHLASWRCAARRADELALTSWHCPSRAGSCSAQGRRLSARTRTLTVTRFIVGYINQEFRLTFLWLSAGGAIAAVVTRALTLTLTLLTLTLTLTRPW